jgi:hypothetical protein
MYKLFSNQFGKVESISRTNDDGSQTSIPLNPDNTDYQTYLKWLEEGNTPLPADEQGAQA